MMLNDYCAIVLSGGKSSRMGRDKSDIRIKGRTLLEIQLDKLIKLGIPEIMISGKDSPAPKAVCVPDVIPERGPLGGMYSCFLKASKKHALVIGVDIPNISVETLLQLINAHENSDHEATVLSHKGNPEPLIAVYNTDTTHILKNLIDENDLKVRSFIDRLNCGSYEFSGEASQLINCNRPEDLKSLTAPSLP